MSTAHLAHALDLDHPLGQRDEGCRPSSCDVRARDAPCERAIVSHDSRFRVDDDRRLDPVRGTSPVSTATVAGADRASPHET